MAHRTLRPSRRLGHRRPQAKANNAQAYPSYANMTRVKTDVLTIATVQGNADKLDVQFSLPISVISGGIPPVTDFIALCGGETTRHAILYTRTAPNKVRVTLSGALTGAKNYNCSFSTVVSGIVPLRAVWGIKAKTVAT